jgi:ABC-2 type transport system ATP-binding protein
MATDRSKPLIVESVSKNFKAKKVLDNISLTVSPGEIYGLIGLNGVGKTTLIKIILDLLMQDSGKVEFFGVNASITASRTNINYLPEKFYPSQFLKGKEFLELALSYYGKVFDIKKAEEKASVLGLDPAALQHTIQKYSKGMGQKLGLLSMFLCETPLLILDEPMSGLDPSARIQLKDLLNDYKKQGKTVFFSSHILSDIEEICDNIAVIHDGRIIFAGAPRDFLTKHGGKNLERSFLEAISA